MDVLHELESLILEDRSHEAVPRIRRALDGVADMTPDEAVRWCQLALLAGLNREADAAVRTALLQAPGHPALLRIAADGAADAATDFDGDAAPFDFGPPPGHERGGSRRATPSRAQRRTLAHAVDIGPEADPPDETDLDPYADVDPAAVSRFLHTFAGREGIHARQWVDNAGRHGYSPTRTPITPDLVRAHLRGDHTIGAYVVRVDNTVTFGVLDLDVPRRQLELAAASQAERERLRQQLHAVTLRVLARLREVGLPVLAEDSGWKGRHFWLLLRHPLPASLIHHLGRDLLRDLAPTEPTVSFEFFPKQARVPPDGVGNLVKLPLGFHRMTGRRSVLLGPDGHPAADPWALLRDTPRLGREDLIRAWEGFRPPIGAGDTPVPGSPVVPVEHAHPGRSIPPRDADDDGPVDPHDPHGDGPPGLRGVDPSGARNGGSTHHSDGHRATRQLRDPFPRGPSRPRGKPSMSVEDGRRTEPFATILDGCAVLDHIVRRAEQLNTLRHHEQVVLIHALGHLPQGNAFVNGVLRLCPGVGAHQWLGNPLRGHPISCVRIRERLPDVTSTLPCHCAFDCADDNYPTPGLHAAPMLEDLPPPRHEPSHPEPSHPEPHEDPMPVHEPEYHGAAPALPRPFGPSPMEPRPRDLVPPSDATGPGGAEEDTRTVIRTGEEAP